MEDNSISSPWSLIPKSNIKNYVHLINLDLEILKKFPKDRARYIDLCESYASKAVGIDGLLPSIQSPSKREFWESCYEMWCGFIKLYTFMLELREEKYKSCLERQPELLQGLATMDTQVMEKLLGEYTAEEDILIKYMETYETPLLPEGLVYEKYQQLRYRVDERLNKLEIEIKELKTEIKTGQVLQSRIEYEKEFGQGAKDFIMIWILNRALVFVLTLH
ncbi:uncharacterized protein LAJ45_04645 [Morchella importuna]|uniref:Uncharacterized protein n=1 Tax=Morchella conica CCBAS932 TaxID=1392247 RepID=A0A3N4KDA2_9PEZI|nr:uncharacterized protein LAJ45_04645 [Morchella importuna]KAH8151440.1 hypothetical protein LAJ45_04645 [Morchella importuna]RPB08493.1 hypothetical protein P167DRAFT_578184 [Morchella conica CCBAS932]